jgi:hypothetical protein
LPAAATSAATCRPGKSLRSQDRCSQHNHNHCFESCLFHFRFLSFIFIPLLFSVPFWDPSIRIVEPTGKWLHMNQDFQENIRVIMLKEGNYAMKVQS